jgi:hypothetical protein
MARKDINVGLTGNDGTGDSIRDAFSKVNSNFQELYASQGLEAGLSFNNLVDVVKPLRPNTVLGLDNLGNNIISRDFIVSNGLTIDSSSDPSKIILGLAGIQINLDPNPTLSNSLNAAGFRLNFLADPAGDQDAVTRKWVYQNFLNRDNIDLLSTVENPNGSVMRKNFRIVPFPDNGNTNIGDKTITIKGSDGITDKEIELKFQAVDPADAVRKDYVDTKLSLQGTNTYDPQTGLINQGAGVMTGPLILNDHPGPYTGIQLRTDGTSFEQTDYRAATKGYVDSKSYSSPTNIFVSTIGNDDMWDFDNDRPNPAYGYPEEEIGRSWSKAFKSLRQACRFAKKYMDRVALQNTPYQVLPAQVQRWVPPFTNALTSPRTRVRISIQNHGFVDGDYVQVSGAILGSIDTRNLNGIHRVNKINDNLFELNLKSLVNWPQPQVATNCTISIALANKKDGPYSTLSRVDFGFRGFFVPKPEITIMVESGVYYEYLPIIVPPNVAIKGDEFRRTLVRPKEGPVLPENENLKFVRGDRSLGADFWYNNHYYRQLAISVGSTNVTGSIRLEIRNSAYMPKSGLRFVFGSTGGVPNVYRVGTVRNIIFKETDPLTNVAPGTYVMDIVDDNGDPKPLAQSIPDGTVIQFLLDNEHCDTLLVSDAMQLRNMSFLGCKGFTMAFDPNGQILTRSPYGQICATFAGEGGGGQLVDGMAGNQVCYVFDTSYTDPFTGTQGSVGTKLTVTGLVRRPEIPNTFYVAKKKYVIIDSTTPDVNGTATLTLSATTPIEVDDTYLPGGFIPNGTQILIETAGNRSMLSNDFTMVNDLGYGIVAENNGVCEAVSQFTYYCRIGYLAKAGGQIRSVTGSSCYGLIGLQSEGNDPNEAIQIGKIRSTPVNLVQPYIDSPLADGNIGAVNIIVGGADTKPVRNSTFKLDRHEVIIKNVSRARLSGGTLVDGPIVVTTSYSHPFVTGDSVQMTSIRGVELKPLVPGGENRTSDIDGRNYTITVVDKQTFTLNGTDSLLYANDLGTYTFNDLPARAISVFVENAVATDYTVKGDPSPLNITGVIRYDAVSDNAIGQRVLKVFKLQRPAVLKMQFTYSTTLPKINDSDTTFTVIGITPREIKFQASPRLGETDNKPGDTILYIANVTPPDGGAVVTSSASPWAPKAGWSFQLLDTNLTEIDYERYTVIGTPEYDIATERWQLTLDKALTYQMIDQVASSQFTRVDGYWDLTLDRNIPTGFPNNTVITFSNSYWNLSVDPALTSRLPFRIDSFNKPQAKTFNLYQLKTISVSQIINNPPIVNSSALRFSTSNYDPSIYRILGKTIDGGTTVETYQLTEVAEPLTGFNSQSVAKIQANKPFIQQETIKYLSTIYPDFVYNQDTCYRDVGLIVDAIIYDLTYGGNVRSRAAGVSYYQQGNPSAALVLSSQKEITIDAINYATLVAQYVVNQYIGSTTPQLALPYRGSNLDGVQQLVDNKEFIQEDVIAFLNNAYPGFNYDEEKCRRDVELIINAVLDDVVLGTNYRSITAGLAYLRSYSSTVIDSQKIPTIAGIERARNLAIALITDATTITAITTNFGIVTGIINTGTNPTQLVYTNPLSVDVGVVNTVNMLRANIEFIQNEFIAYVNANFIGYDYSPAVQAKCERDLGYIIDAVLYDTVFGTNFNAVTAGLAYQRANSSYLQAEQKIQTIQGILKAKTIIQSLVNNDVTVLSRVTSGFDTVVALLEGGISPTLNYPTPIGAGQEKINAKDQLQQNRAFIQSEIIAFVNVNNPPSNYNQAKCSRDVGYIVDALCYDLLYGGNSASVKAAEAYFVGTTGQLGAGQATATVNAYSRLQVVAGQIIQGTIVARSSGNNSTQNRTGSFGTSTEATTATGLIEIIKGVISAGSLNTLPATVNPSRTLVEPTLNIAFNLVSTEKAQVISDVSDYIISAFSAYNYDPALCLRDVQYILDAVTYDTLYGGNSQSIGAGAAYWIGAVSLIPGQIDVTILAFTHLKNVVDQILQAQAIVKTVGNTFNQNTNLPPGSTASRTTVDNLLTVVNTITEFGVNAGPTPIFPAYTNGVNYNTANNSKITILNNLTTIKNGVISYLNTTFSSGFTYNQTKCRRDVGLIVDAIAYDLEYGGNVKSRIAALKYYEGSQSADVVLQTQKAQTVAAIRHAKAIAKLIVLEGAVIRQSGNTRVQNTSGTPGVFGIDDNRVEVLFEVVAVALESGVNTLPIRDLGIARSYQDPTDGSYVPQVINNSLISEVGAGVRIGQLMGQIVSIINLGTTGTHVIQEPQVIDTLQSLTLPATATSLQYGGILTGIGIPTRGIDGVTEDTFIRTVTQLFDDNQNTIGYRVKISAVLTQSLPIGTDITISGPGSNYLFDLNTDLDARHLAGDVIGITTTFSTVRATGHDFLQVGAGGYDDSNYPNNVYGPPVNSPSSSAIVKEVGTGRVFHVSTDQDGNFRVGSFFNVNQGDGSVTIAAKIGLSAVSSLTFLTGETVRAFLGDSKMDDNSDNIVPTQKAIKTYISSVISGRFTVDNTETPNKGLLTLDGTSIMKGNINVGFNSVENAINSVIEDGTGLVNRKYVDNVFAGGTIDYDGNYGITTTGVRNNVQGFSMLFDATNTGGVFLNRGGIDLNNNKITNVKQPTSSLDAANKQYVDQTLATGGIRSGWTGFTLNDTVTRYFVNSVTMTAVGAGYTIPPVVTFYSTSGTGATGRAVLEAGTGPRGVQSIVVETPGYGYTSAPTIIIGGSVAVVNLVSAGFGYSDTPEITFSAPQTVGGVRTTGYAVMEGTGVTQRIKQIIIINAGSGYTIPPIITQTYIGTVPSQPAVFSVQLQGGTGATAGAVIAALQKDINLNGNKVTGSSDPISSTDLVTLNYFNNKNYVRDISDVTITGSPNSGDFLVFTGEIPEGSGGSMVNASVSSTSDVTIARTGNSIAITIKANSINNNSVSNNAGILQSKLSLNRSSVQSSLANTASNDFGVTAFQTSEFTSNSGFIQLRQASDKSTGVRLDRIQQITNRRILGRWAPTEGDASNGAIQELDSNTLKEIVGLTTSSVGLLISDDTLGGEFADGTVAPLSPRDSAKSGGATSYGALLKVGGTMRGKITLTGNGLLSGPSSPSITPIIAVGPNDNENLDIGTSALRFRDIYSRSFRGTNFYGTGDFGSLTAPTTINQGARFNGTATFAATGGKTPFGLAGSTDVFIRNQNSDIVFDGSTSATVTVNADANSTNNSIVRRTSNSSINANTFISSIAESSVGFVGMSTRSLGLYLGGTTYAPTSIATGTGTALIINGVINATTFNGTANFANYKDLAENYVADAQYEPGTVLEFGGEFEVTLAEDETRRVAGVVSTDPAYLMGNGHPGEFVVPIALQGRVPCKVRGKIRKGDMMVSAGGGYARPTHDPKIGTIIGKALQDFDGGEGVIEVVVGRL